jgi:ribosomal protein S18 acetylase RimI-like enzyme
VGVAAPGYGESLAALHESCFPNSYYSGSQVLEKPAEPGGKFMLLAEGDGDACHGYVFLEVDAEVGEAHIHFLAVAQSHRRRGLGRRLLIAGMHWMFSHPAVDRVGLIVDPDNAGALRLYQATGWTRERETEAWRRTRE